jgi:hypothetical protein
MCLPGNSNVEKFFNFGAAKQRANRAVDIVTDKANTVANTVTDKAKTVSSAPPPNLLASAASKTKTLLGS